MSRGIRHQRNSGLMKSWPLLFVSLYSVIVICDLAFFEFSVATAILDGTLAACIASLVVIVLWSKPAPTALFAMLYMIFFYTIPALIHINVGAFPFFNKSYTESEMEWAASASLLFSLFFWFGYGSRIFAAAPEAKSVSGLQSQVIGVTIILCFCLLSLGFGAIAGFGVLNTRRGDVGQLYVELTPATLAVQSLARTSGFLALLFSVARLVRLKNIESVLVALLGLACFWATNNPLSLARYVMGAYVITLIVCFFPLTRLRKALIAGAVAVGQVTLFPAADAITRRSGVFDFSPIEYLSTHPDFDGFQSTMNVVRMAHAEGIGWGHQLLSAVLFFVPRSVWPDKSPGTGLEGAAYVGYPYVNISAPLPSEFFADFHFVGVVIGAYLFGRVLRLSDETFSKRTRLGIFDAYVAGTALAAGFVFIVMRGSLVAVVGPLALSLALVVCAHFAQAALDSIRGPLYRKRMSRKSA